MQTRIYVLRGSITSLGLISIYPDLLDGAIHVIRVTPSPLYKESHVTE